MKAKKLRWDNLKSMKCPQCHTGNIVDKGDVFHCSDEECVFLITREKFNEMVKILYSKSARNVPVRSEMENLSELNNLGFAEMSEGFAEEIPEFDIDI